MTRPRYTAGVAFIELIVYVALLAAMTTVVVSGLTPVLQSYARLEANRTIVNSANVALERFVRDTRAAAAVDAASSTFAAHPGELVVESPATTTRFFANGGRMYVSVNDGADVPMTSNDITVDSLIFRHATTSQSAVVRMELSASAQTRTGTTSKTFAASAVLRGGY